MVRWMKPPRKRRNGEYTRMESPFSLCMFIYCELLEDRTDVQCISRGLRCLCEYLGHAKDLLNNI